MNKMDKVEASIIDLKSSVNDWRAAESSSAPLTPLTAGAETDVKP